MFLWPFRLILKIIGAVLAVVLLYVSVTLVQVWLTSMQDDPHPANAILVFGTAANYTTPGVDLEARLARALTLYDAHLAPIIAVTGGKRPGDLYTEAQISAMWLETNGVPPSAIVLGSGADTWNNVASVATELKTLGVVTVLDVTDPFHEDRAMAITSSFGFSPSPTPSQRSPIGGFNLVLYFVKEAVEVSVGRIIGYQTLAGLPHVSVP
jgi:uncharacterized SAM-binding protein YcdF (DUF218 family)